jgi:hypothetical protein
MNLRDDEDIFRARLLWLGPPGHTLPVHLPYAQWGAGALLTAVISTVLVLATGDFAWIGAGLAAGIALTKYIWRFVDPDRPARAVVRAAVIDAKTIQPPADDRLPRLVACVTVRPEITKD